MLWNRGNVSLLLEAEYLNLNKPIISFYSVLRAYNVPFLSEFLHSHKGLSHMMLCRWASDACRLYPTGDICLTAWYSLKNKNLSYTAKFWLKYKTKVKKLHCYRSVNRSCRYKRERPRTRTLCRQIGKECDGNHA